MILIVLEFEWIRMDNSVSDACRFVRIFSENNLKKKYQSSFIFSDKIIE